MKQRSAAIFLSVSLTVALAADATPYTLTVADRSEITALARSFFEATRDGTRAVSSVYPSPVDLRGLFVTSRAGASGAGPSPVEATVQRQLESIERDARALRDTFRDGVFVGISERSYPQGRVDLRPCSRLARATSQCGDGPLIEYTVRGETRRFRLDTLVRLRGHWRVFDVRP